MLDLKDGDYFEITTSGYRVLLASFEEGAVITADMLQGLIEQDYLTAQWDDLVTSKGNQGWVINAGKEANEIVNRYYQQRAEAWRRNNS